MRNLNSDKYGREIEQEAFFPCLLVLPESGLDGVVQSGAYGGREGYDQKIIP